MDSIVEKIKVRSKTFNSIKNKLITYITVVFILVIGVVLLGNFNYSAFFQEYNKLYMEYNSLNKFYSSLNDATEHIKSYCYSHDDKDYSEYMKEIRLTSENMEYLKSSASDDDTAWEYSMLSNMLDTYKETVGATVSQIRDTSNSYSIVGYQKIVNINELINGTVVKYFTVIIKDMNTSRVTLYEKWSMQRYITLFILAAIFVFGGVFSILLLRSVTRPIGQLVKNVKRFMEGTYDVPAIKGGGAEIEILLNAFNKMATSLGFYIREMQEKAQLQQQLLERENDNLRMRDVLRETELRALQSQMNPHFLLNTLSIISKMAYIEGAKQTFELMESTTELLRYNLDKCSKVSDLNAEIECIRNYLYIQRKRFGERIKFELLTEDGLPDVKMPALIIQPMVENAIIHGVDDMVRGGFVKVTAKKVNNIICLNIEDNGNGIDSEIIERFMSIDTQNPEEGLGIGIVNVKRRLEMFFGIKGLLNIESSLGCGTVVTVNIPFNERSEEANYV